MRYREWSLDRRFPSSGLEIVLGIEEFYTIVAPTHEWVPDPRRVSLQLIMSTMLRAGAPSSGWFCSSSSSRSRSTQSALSLCSRCMDTVLHVPWNGSPALCNSSSNNNTPQCHSEWMDGWMVDGLAVQHFCTLDRHRRMYITHHTHSLSSSPSTENVVSVCFPSLCLSIWLAFFL